MQRAIAEWSGHVTVRPMKAQVITENGGWSIVVPGLPVVGEGHTLEDAVEEVIDSLRDYAEEWIDDLHLAPNHAQNWGVVRLVSLSADAQLRDWIIAHPPGDPRADQAILA